MYKLLSWLFIIIGWIGICYSGYFAFNNPELTSTQVFLEIWEVYLGIIVSFIMGIVSAHKITWNN